MPACTTLGHKATPGRSRRAGFTMVEMLTVIAIIALLSAVLFPVMAAVRRTARKSACISNMQQLSQAINLYHDTWHRYPLVLDAVVIGNSSPPLRPLFPQFAKSEEIFRCPVNTYRSSDTALPAFSGSQLVTGVKRVNGSGNGGPLQACLDSRNGPRSLRVSACGANETAASPVQFPMRDSYDGAFVPNQSNSTWELHYSRDWTEGMPIAYQGAADIPRQLKFRNPPANTVITWCLNHVDNYTGGVTSAPVPHGRVPTLFRDGTVKQLRGELFVDWRSTVQPAPGLDGNTWRVLP